MQLSPFDRLGLYAGGDVVLYSILYKKECYRDCLSVLGYQGIHFSVLGYQGIHFFDKRGKDQKTQVVLPSLAVSHVASV